MRSFRKTFTRDEDSLVLSLEVELTCIADWKDGSDMFMYGRLTAPTLLEDHTKYRCFVSFFFISRNSKPFLFRFTSHTWIANNLKHLKELNKLGKECVLLCRNTKHTAAKCTSVCLQMPIVLE